MYVLCLFYFATIILNNLPTAFGDHEVPIERFPYQLAVYIKTGFFSKDRYACSAVLIDKDTALSAARCFDKNEKYKIRAGSAKVGGGSSVDVKVVIHPKYKCHDGICDYDIAILHLKKSLTFSKKIQPVKLPDHQQTIPIIIKGYISTWDWGFYHKGRSNLVPNDSKLRAIKLSKINCENSIYERLFCVGTITNKDNHCEVDAGGPFVVDEILYGIVSSIKQCDKPFYLTSIPALRNYIKDAVGI